MLESLFNKVAGLQASNFINKRHQHRRFPVDIGRLLRKPILKSIFEWLLLGVANKIYAAAKLPSLTHLQSICITNQMTVLYMTCNAGLIWVEAK